MMWNLKYGMMGGQGGFGMMGGMMGGFYRRGFSSTPGRSESGDMPVSPEEAVAAAQEYLDDYLPGAEVDEHADPLYGYYTLHILEEGKVSGMLSVNGYTLMAARLEPTEAMRRQLIGDVAHELRTPLTALKGYAEGLLDSLLPPDEDTFQQIYAEADRLERLVSDLQELSRVEARAFELNRRPLSVRAILETAIARLGASSKRKVWRWRSTCPRTFLRSTATSIG